MILLSNPKRAKEIYSLTSLFYLKIKVEAYKTLDVLNMVGNTPPKFSPNSRMKNQNAATIIVNTPKIIEDATFTLT